MTDPSRASGRRLARWVERFQGARIVVAGDLCLDEYIVGRAQRLSREAPVPVLEFTRRFTVPGAACNPALNVQAVGGRASMVGVVGDDEAGRTLTQSLAEAGIDTSGVIVDPGRPTILKTRVLAEHLFPQQVARVDRQERGPLKPSIRAALKKRLVALMEDADAVLFSDYRSGVLDRPLVSLARGGKARVTVDSQGDFLKFGGVDLLRCNREEAAGFLGRRFASDDSYVQAGLALRKKLDVAAVAITRGGEGLTVVDQDGLGHHIPASNPSEVYDVTGAGDTVIAMLTLALCAGAPLFEAAQLANLAAGQVVRKLGNATVTREELEGLMT